MDVKIDSMGCDKKKYLSINEIRRERKKVNHTSISFPVAAFGFIFKENAQEINLG
jgi:hypothetical protein